MNRIEIDWLEDLPAGIEALVEAGHAAYEADHGVCCDYRAFSLVLRDEDGAVAGVLRAYTAYAEIYVDDLWVAADRRGKGYGRALLETLETRFAGQGFNNINLVTNAFQAAAFYKACGYEVEFERVNRHNPELGKTFFIRYFDNVRQHRGILGKSGEQAKGAGDG